MYEVLGRGANIAIKRFAFFFSSSIFTQGVKLRYEGKREDTKKKKYALEIIQTFRS
jgi:hypothetical protein